jgi:hypothetical protein
LLPSSIILNLDIKLNETLKLKSIPRKPNRLSGNWR